jgi:hypothetical protein
VLLELLEGPLGYLALKTGAGQTHASPGSAVGGCERRRGASTGLHPVRDGDVQVANPPKVELLPSRIHTAELRVAKAGRQELREGGEGGQVSSSSFASSRQLGRQSSDVLQVRNVCELYVSALWYLSVTSCHTFSSCHRRKVVLPHSALVEDPSKVGSRGSITRPTPRPAASHTRWSSKNFSPHT